MSLTSNSFQTQTQPLPIPSTPAKPTPQATPASSLATVAPNPTKVTVEVPTNSSIPFNPFDPSWVKLWEQVGPTSYLALLCVLIWLLTRFVESVKGK